MATISAVLYANANHPELKIEYPNWSERCKQILKKWRALSTDKKAPYLQRARENRTYLKKTQQVSDDSSIENEISVERDAVEEGSIFAPIFLLFTSKKEKKININLHFG